MPLDLSLFLSLSILHRHLPLSCISVFALHHLFSLLLPSFLLSLSLPIFLLTARISLSSRVFSLLLLYLSLPLSPATDLSLHLSFSISLFCLFLPNPLFMINLSSLGQYSLFLASPPFYSSISSLFLSAYFPQKGPLSSSLFTPFLSAFPIFPLISLFLFSFLYILLHIIFPESYSNLNIPLFCISSNCLFY